LKTLVENVSLNLSMPIPKILYQTWKSTDLPEKFQKNHETWLALTPEEEGWTHLILTDEDLRDLVKQHFPQFLEAYDGFTKNIERVDFARYVMMYLGGVYADLDTYPARPLDIFINQNRIILGREPLEHARDIYSREVVICNAFMMSPAGDKFWVELMNYIIANYEHYYRPVDNTGPMAITYFMEKHPEAFSNVDIKDPCVFFPLMGNGKISKECNLKDESNPEKITYVVHEWENTWVTSWWNDSMWFNRRIWFWVIFALFVILFIWCWVKQRSTH
jgi:hypothetical protein